MKLSHLLYFGAACAALFCISHSKAATITVTNPGDSGAGTLRQAIIDNEAAGGGNTINFSVTGAITLTSDKLSINKDVTIAGPGARLLTVQRSTASGTPDFGIFRFNGGTVNISGLTITNASGAEGLSNVAGTSVNVSDCTITGNNNTGSFGGGIFSQTGTVTLINCSITNNTALQAGGIQNQSTMLLINCTVANNTATTTATSSGGGGGITNTNGGTITLVSCTISGNSATTNQTGGGGGGVFTNSGTVHMGNTIVAGNTTNQTGDDVRGAFASNGYNLIRIADGSTGFNKPGDQVGTAANPLNANLGVLKDNGGPTDTKALGAASPAINAANPSGVPARDQRNYLRPDAPDIGAFEFNGIIPVTLANISTRLRVETGDNALIGGFIVTGTDAKKVIVLAIGPSLPFPDKLANPTLDLYQGDTLLESNDDWVTSTNKQAIMDSGAAPPKNLESAIIRTLPANNTQYTAIVRGAGNGTGIGSVQVYDLDRTTNSKLANISTRGLVQTGDNVMIAGFIISGVDQQKVIVRAIGPSLTVPGKLTNPTLQLVNQQGTILDENDDWQQSTNKQAIIDSGVAPTDPSESAIIATLPSNNAQYTAIVRGAGGATGVAVVQVYALN